MEKFKRILFLLLILFSNHALRASETPLHKASYAQDIESVRRISEAHPEWINQINQEGNTPLHLACQSLFENQKNEEEPLHSLATVMFLLQKGAHVASQNKKGETPLHISAKHKNLYSVTLLLIMRAMKQASQCNDDNFLKTFVNLSDRSGRGAFSYAAQSGSSETLKLLSENGARKKLLG